MKKLTAEKCRERIKELRRSAAMRFISIRETEYLEALEIALPILDQQESQKEVSHD